MSTSPPSSESILDQLASDYAERLRSGERPSLTEYIDKHPELEDAIREMFPALAMMEEYRPTSMELDCLVNADGTALKQLGEYDIIREVGRGGMGVVYEAEQKSLDRRVALKVIPFHSVLNPRQIERFQREARAAAQLHHTNIVPVFGVGQDNGIHYYAMQFIEGVDLDNVMKQLIRLRQTQSGKAVAVKAFPDSSVAVANLLSSHSSADNAYFKSVAQIGIQVAQALDYAHEQRILHRDIKPSNLLLDSAGCVWITDFGLAKEEDSEDLTHTGDIVGTLRYIAPERISGQLDRRADIYGLGLTLYELLTLQPAITGQDRARLIDQISHVMPTRPRKIDAQIPRDLETIVLKSIAKDPAQRYQLASELADDLLRFCENRSIVARRTPLLERVWRWSRRNPALSAMAAILFLTITVSFVAVISQWQRAENHLVDAINNGKQADLNFAEADRQRELAEANLEEAHKIVEQYFTQVSENRLLNVPGLQPLRRELLESALVYYQKFIERNQNDPALRLELAKTHWRMARIHSVVGSRANAVEDYEQALEIMEKLFADNEIDDNVRFLYASIETGLGYESMHADRVSRAIEYFESSNRRVSQPVRFAKNEQTKQGRFATNFHNLGYAHVLQKKYSIAAEYYGKSREIKQELAATNPDQYEVSLAQLLRDIGHLHIEQREYKEALEARQQAFILRQKLVDRFPDVISYRAEFAESYNRIADVYRISGQFSEAIEPYLQSIKLQTDLVRSNPNVTEFRAELANSYYNLAGVYRRTNQLDKAITNLNLALEQLLKVHETDPSNKTHIRSLAWAYRWLGNSHSRQLNWSKSVAAYRQAVEFRKTIAESEDGEDRQRLGEYYYELSHSLLYDGGFDEALATGKQAMVINRHFHRLEPDSTLRTWLLAKTLRHVAMVLRRQKKFEEALTLFDESIAKYNEAYGEDKSYPNQLGWYSFSHFARGATLRDLDRLEEAREALLGACKLQSMHVNRKNPPRSSLKNQDRFLAFLASIEMDLGLLENASQSSLSRSQVWPKQPGVLLDIARSLSVIAALARDSKDPQQVSQFDKYVDHSLDSLEGAVAAGFSDLKKIRNTSSLDILRDRPRYQALEQRLLNGGKK